MKKGTLAGRSVIGIGATHANTPLHPRSNKSKIKPSAPLRMMLSYHRHRIGTRAESQIIEWSSLSATKIQTKLPTYST